MFNVAPRYLSGISVFLGDDITKRETTGELVVFLGPANKGPQTPVVLKSIDNLVPLFGAGNPLVKAGHQFMDGYADAGANNPLQLVAMRVGGIAAKLTTSFGLVIETEDAYDGIENEFYLWVDDTSDETFNVKIWDKDRLIVFDYAEAVSTGHVKVTVPAVKGSTGAIYGDDLDNDPGTAGLLLLQARDADFASPGTGSTVFGLAASPAAGVSTLVVSNVVGAGNVNYDADMMLFPLSGGRIRIYGNIGAIEKEEFINYTSAVVDVDLKTVTFTLATATSVDFSGVINTNMSIKLVNSVVVSGDSEMDLTKREMYERYRNALLEVETWTPDYLVPGGAYFDDTETYVSSETETTIAKIAQATNAALTGAQGLGGGDYVTVEGAATWGLTGTYRIDSGLQLPVGTAGVLERVSQYFRYSGITKVTDPLVPTAYDYRLETIFDQFEAESNYIALSNTLTLKTKTGGLAIENMLPQGWFRFGTAGNATLGFYKLQGIVDGIATLKIHVPTDFGANIAVAIEPDTDGIGALPIAGDVFEMSFTSFDDAGSYVYGYWTESQNVYDIGVGYVKETDQGDAFTFEWADQKKAGFYLAHFGYLFANFCNEATIGYNTPLTAMNVRPPSSLDRAAIVQWIGEKPLFKMVAGEPTAIENVSKKGAGLLGNAVMAGGIAPYNRTYLNDAANNKFVDPAYGLLMTSQGFVDGNEIRDSYGKVVDLGKFMCVGAGLLTFAHRANGVPYTDACGIYSLGMLAGSPYEEGISFKQVGTNSGSTVSVIVNRKLYNDLAGAGYIVITREKGLGWVINNDHSVARKDSGYRLISTTRIVKTVIEEKRGHLMQFIGKPINTYYYEAAKTKLSESFKNDVSRGLLNGYRFNLSASKSGQAIGKLYLSVVINPPLELTQVDIDTVIDRNLTNT